MTGPPRRRVWTLLGILIATSLLALLAGRYPNAGFSNPAALLRDPLSAALLWRLRLPRVMAALLVGASLGGAGLVLQMLFANPLVEPGLVGISQGAAFGAAASIVLAGNAVWLTQGSAAAGAIVGLAASYAVARRMRFGGWVLRLILAGIAVSALFSAGVGIIKFAADPLDELPAITFWMLGGLWNSGWHRVATVAPVAIPSLLVLLLFRWRVNLLSLEDTVTFSLGVSLGRERVVVLAAATAATAACISIAGIVNWVGLVVPHMARRWVGTDARYALPAAILGGATLTLVCDTVARTVVAGEIPLGVVTALLGAVAFIVLTVSKGINVSR